VTRTYRAQTTKACPVRPREASAVRLSSSGVIGSSLWNLLRPLGHITRVRSMSCACDIRRWQLSNPNYVASPDRSYRLHEARTRRSFRASSSASKARARGTVGNPSRKSSRVSPPSRYSKSVWTGTRVPRNTGTPCMVSGSAAIAWVTTLCRSVGSLRATSTAAQQAARPSHPHHGDCTKALS